MVLDQVGILLTGVIAVWLTQHKREGWRRWACIFGLLGQPFWFYAAWKAEQWGILAISTLYAYAWARASGRIGSHLNALAQPLTNDRTFFGCVRHGRQLQCSGRIASRRLVALRNVLQHTHVAFDMPSGVTGRAQLFKGT